MKIEQIGSLVSTVANLGVLLGLIVVLYELNQNNISLRNDVAWSHTAVISELTISSAVDPGLAEFVIEARSWQEGEFYEKAGTPEQIRFSWYMTARVNYLQGRYLTETSEDDLESLRVAFDFYISCPAEVDYWLAGATQGILDSEFVAFGNNIISERGAGERRFCGMAGS